MTRHPPDAGYDEPEGDDGEFSIVSFDLVIFDKQFTRDRVICTLVRDGKNCGLIHVNSRGEYEWLRDRIRGRYEPPG